MINNPQVSIISINYNGVKDTCEMIDSVKSNIKSISYEIIIVDNCSKNDDATEIAQKYPDVRIIRSDVNLGFSGGNNLGIKVAKGDYIFLLNNDTLVLEDTLNHLVEKLESSSVIGAISPKICYSYARNKIQFAGFTKLSKFYLRNTQIGYNELDNGRFDLPLKIPYAHGAAMLIKKDVIRRVGLMPELYFLYYEELDWSTSITEQGFEIWYEPKCKIFHKESQSVGFNSPVQVYYLTRNRLLYACRHLKGTEKVITISYLLTLPILKNVLKYISKRRFDLMERTFSGAFDFFRIKDKKRKYEFVD